MAAGCWPSQLGIIEPSMTETPNTNRFLVEFMSTNCRFDTPTATMIPATRHNVSQFCVDETKRRDRAVLTNRHIGHVPRAPGFFLFEGPQLAVVK